MTQSTRQIPDATALHAKQEAALAFIFRRGAYGATADEAIEHFSGPPFNWSENTAPPRFVELAKAGLIEKARDADGRWMRRPTRSQGTAQVWRRRTHREPTLFD